MDRGRPKKRPEGTTPRPSVSKVTQLAEQKAFESLPQGIKANESHARYDPTEINALRNQALGQAAKFEVLSFKDVEVLSRVRHGPLIHMCLPYSSC
jgi:hypothetical protein